MSDKKVRRKGSGRTKGAVSLVTVKLATLKEKFNDEDLIVVGRVFMRDAGIEADSAHVKTPITPIQKMGISLTIPE
jgi:hypothetical protein